MRHELSAACAIPGRLLTRYRESEILRAYKRASTINVPMI